MKPRTKLRVLLIAVLLFGAWVIASPGSCRQKSTVDVDQVKSAWPAATNADRKPVAGEAGP